MKLNLKNVSYCEESSLTNVLEATEYDGNGRSVRYNHGMGKISFSCSIILFTRNLKRVVVKKYAFVFLNLITNLKTNEV